MANDTQQENSYEQIIKKLMEYEEGCPPMTLQEYSCECQGDHE